MAVDKEFRKNIRINIFITIKYLKHFYLIPPLIFAFLVLSDHIHLIVLHNVRSLSPGMSLVALLCIVSSIFMSFLRYGFHACIQYST